MLSITDRAEEHLLRVRAERGFRTEHAARFVAGTGSVALTFAPAPAADDCVLDGAALQIFVSIDAAEALDDAVLDVGRDGDRPTLVLRSRRASVAGVPIPEATAAGRR